MKRLFIGPWVGEFGIELLRWQGYARTVATQDSWDDVIVATRPDRYYLYEDFAHRFVAYSPQSIHTEANRCRDHVYNDLHRQFINEHNGDRWLSPLLEKPVWNREKHRMREVTTYVDLGTRAVDVGDSFDILIHARATGKDSAHEKNWPVDHWDTLIAELAGKFSIASIGSLDGAHHIEGTFDRRGIPLNELAGHCRNAKLMVGPSSGPLHFAVLSRLPVVTWVHTQEPYRNTWNPFRVPLCCLPLWQPDPFLVRVKINHLLNTVTSPPPAYAIVGTKRSGHHAVIDWVTKLDGKRRIVHLNDCTADEIKSTPPVPFHIPSSQSAPKLLNEPRPNNATRVYNEKASGDSVSILSYEEPPLRKLAGIKEIRDAPRLVFILRDRANFLASLKKGVNYYANRPFSHECYARMLRIYREYLAEALGRTTHLASLSAEVTFVSFNRWHIDEDYRRDLSASLGLGRRDADRHRISRYGPGSSFDKDPLTDARTLDVNHRWQAFAGDASYLTLLEGHALNEMERLFHGSALPDLAAIRRARSNHSATS